MKKITFLLIFIFLINIINCSNNKDNVNVNINVNPEYLKNGSVSIYSVSDSETDEITYFTNYILVQPENILIIRDLNNNDEERIQRYKIDKENLSILSSEVVKSVNNKQDNLYTGTKKGKYFELVDNTNKEQKTKRIDIGNNQYFEDDIILQLISCFPLNKDQIHNFKYVSTLDLLEGEESYKVIGEDTVMVMSKKFNSIKVELINSRCTAWFLEENPHILLRAVYPDNVIEIINWNYI
jgi:hypothetical protein